MTTQNITLSKSELFDLVREAAIQGANQIIDDMVCYHYNDACKRLGISYNTLQKRIQEKKIRPIDGRITGAEIRRYLQQIDQ